MPGLKIREDVWRRLSATQINKAVELGLRILARNPHLARVYAKEAAGAPSVFTRATVPREVDEVAEAVARAAGVSKHAVYAAAVVAYLKHYTPF
ncbi:MAG: hypothetical protein ACPL3C_09845 [Pyrobaculum sp.]|uniref:hypothetical protein n=1 Tax=Pyrobaculum sp. TaxID=2004705 RepID=UPI003CA108DE